MYETPEKPSWQDCINTKMIECRIACYEAGYPSSEACYSSVEEWEAFTGKSFVGDVLFGGK